MIPLGLSGAAAVRVGRAYGARDRLGVDRATLTACAVATALALLITAAAALWPGAIAGVFTRDPALLAMATPAVLLASLFLWPDALQSVLANALRARADVAMPTVFHIASYLGVMLPLGWVFAHPLKGGVAGCIWSVTLASYLVEGGPSKQQSLTKAMMLSDPELFRDLLTRLARIAAQSLREQVSAGAQAVQVFDSWIGTLSREQYREHILPVMTELFDELAELGVPRTIFGVGTGHLLDLLADTGADCVGIDWRIDLRDARQIVPERCALQGNLDPAVLLAPDEVIEAQVRRVLGSAPSVGHVFNLGHGVLPETPPEVPGRIVELVHQLTAAKTPA